MFPPEKDIIVHPRRGKKEKPVPAKGSFFVTPREAAIAHELLLGRGGKKRFLFNSKLTVSACGEYFVAGPAVGAPMAVMTMEKLIALGGSSIVMYGWCGACSNRFAVADVLLGGKGVSGEGTSLYYPVEGEVVPDNRLRSDVAELLLTQQLPVKNGIVWTTDAPYRESRAQLAQLSEQQGVGVVDMEYSALCRLAMFRRVSFTAVLLVSDELYRETWTHGFRDETFQQYNRKIVEILSGDLRKGL